MAIGCQLPFVPELRLRGAALEPVMWTGIGNPVSRLRGLWEEDLARK